MWCLISPKPCEVWQWKELLIVITFAVATSTVLEVKTHHVCLCGTEAFALREISASLQKLIYRLKKLILISYLKWMTEFLPVTKWQLALNGHNGSQNTFWWLLCLITTVTYNGKRRVTCFFVQRTRQVQKNVYTVFKTPFLCSIPLYTWKDGGAGEGIDKWKQCPAECITKTAQYKRKII